MRHPLFALMSVGWFLVGCASTEPYAGTYARIHTQENILGQQIFEVRVDQIDRQGQTVASLLPATQLPANGLTLESPDLFVATTTLTRHHIVDALDTYTPQSSAFAVVDE